MKRLNLWMLATILTICGTTMLLTSCFESDDNPVKPEQPTERARFEEQLSTTLDASVKQLNLQNTLHATEVLTHFIEQLDVEALAPQISNIMNSVLGSIQPIDFNQLGDQQEEAREALKNTFSNLAEVQQFALVNADKAFNKTRLTFIEGEKEMKYETSVGEGLSIVYKNPTTNEWTDLSLHFSGADDGVIMFLGKIANLIPVAVQFPESINFTINNQTGNVMVGTVKLVSNTDRKYISLRNCEWMFGLGTGAATPDRFEVPMAIMHHYVDGKVDGQVGLSINGTTILGLSISSTGIPYSAEEMEQLKGLREKGSVYAAFYEVLNMFNSRSGDAQLILMEDLMFDMSVKDIALAASALGSAVKLRDSNPSKADIDPLTDQLNQALSFTVEQKSTGITAEGKLVTANLHGITQPALALRFNGESDFKVMYDCMSDADLANYEALLQSFDAPGRQLGKLFNAFDEKRKAFEKVNPFK